MSVSAVGTANAATSQPKVPGALSSHADRAWYAGLNNAQQSEVNRLLDAMSRRGPLSPKQAKAVAPHVKVKVKSSTSRTPVTANTMSKSNKTSARMRPYYTVYNVHSYYNVSDTIFGKTIDHSRLDYRYQTGNNRVLRDQSCSYSFSGLSWGMGIVSSTHHYASGGRGHCWAIIDINEYDINHVSQRQQMDVNGPGIYRKYLKVI